MEHVGRRTAHEYFVLGSLSFQIKFGNALQNPVNQPLRDIEMKSTSTAIFTFRREKSINFSQSLQARD